MDKSITKCEVWKDVSGYEGFYQVSSKGRIKSLSRYVYHKKGNGRRLLDERMMKLKVNRWGYLTVNLSKNSVVKTYQVHRLIADAFYSSEDEGLQVNHKDGDKLNNELDNLELVTSEENIKHGYKEKLIVNVSKRMTQGIADEIRRKYTGSVTQKDLSEEYGFSIRAISKVINNKTW